MAMHSAIWKLPEPTLDAAQRLTERVELCAGYNLFQGSVRPATCAGVLDDFAVHVVAAPVRKLEDQLEHGGQVVLWRLLL